MRALVKESAERKRLTLQRLDAARLNDWRSLEARRIALADAGQGQRTTWECNHGAHEPPRAEYSRPANLSQRRHQTVRRGSSAAWGWREAGRA
jgi:hypothetical protein